MILKSGKNRQMETSLFFSSKKIQNFKKAVKGILCLCKNQPLEKPDNPNEFWDGNILFVK